MEKLHTDLLFGLSAKLLPTKEKFSSGTELVSSFTTIVYTLVIAYCTYNLTGSQFETLLAFIFGGLYVLIAWIYYGLKRYRVVSSK